jgi:hypothetical protein
MKTIIIKKKVINNISYYAFLLTSRSILLYLIIMIIYSVLYIYFFADPLLCEGNETIYDLKSNLITENHKYRVSIINYEMVMDTYKLMIDRPMHERNYDAEIQFLSASRHITNDLVETFGRINSLVTRIQSIEPRFQSPIQAIDYLRITRS